MRFIFYKILSSDSVRSPYKIGFSKSDNGLQTIFENHELRSHSESELTGRCSDDDLPNYSKSYSPIEQSPSQKTIARKKLNKK